MGKYANLGPLISCTLWWFQDVLHFFASQQNAGLRVARANISHSAPGDDECIKMLRRSRMLKLLQEFCTQLQKERETVFGFIFPADLHMQHFTFLAVYSFSVYKNKTK
jgi:hypothetical protein